jgi:DNA repair exonuclease SbcCD ATPase subunit
MTPAPMSRRSSLSTVSDYSINLDALGPSGKDDSSILPLQEDNLHAIDVVHSEDIDGPTDFTQNMEFWMSAKLPNVLQPTKLEGERKSDLEEYVGSDESASDSQGTPKQRQEEAHARQGAQHHDVDQSIMSDASFQNAHEGGMSFLSDIPEDEGSVASPNTVEPASPPNHPSIRRQPTVEDYDGTPIRARDTRSASSSAIGEALRSPELTAKGRPGAKDAEAAYGGELATMKSLEEALQKLRDELAEVKSHSPAEVSRIRQTHDMQIQEERASHEREVKRKESSWKERMSQSSADYQSRLSKLEAQAKSATSLESKLKTATAALNTKTMQTATLEKQLSTQAAELQQSKSSITSLERELETLTETHRITREDFEEDLRVLDDKYSRLHESHESLSTNRMDSDDQVDALKTQIEQIKSRHEMEVACLKAKADETIAKAREDFEGEKANFVLQLDTMREERDDLRAEVALMENTTRNAGQDEQPNGTRTAALEQEYNVLRTQLQETRRECSRLSTELTAQKQKETTDSVNQQTTQSLAQLKSANDVLRSTTKDLEASLIASQSANQILRSSLKDYKSIAASARKEASESRMELSLLREDFEAVNVAVDKRVQDMMKAREVEWARRFERLREEKGVLGKVLMREWGAQEVGGADDPQGYRYQFVRK